MASYTIKEVAEFCGVTKQAVGKYLRTSGLQAQVTKDGNRFLVSDNLRKQIETHFAKTADKSETFPTTYGNSETKTETVSVSESTDMAIAALTNQLAVLQEQLAMKDKQIEKLNDALINAQESAKAAQVLQARAEQPALENAEQKEKRSWWQRLWE